MARKPELIKNRKSAIRQSKPKVLIVCEGQKTEPDYLNEIKNKYRLASVVVIYTSTFGSAPISIVNCANLVVGAIIILWNTVYIQKAIKLVC